MRVLGVGRCTMDYLGVVRRFAEADFKLEFQQFSTQGGGAAATAMVTLARWGVETKFVGKVGDDVRGDEIVGTLVGEGIDTSSMVVCPDCVSQLSFIVVETASRHKQTYFTEGNVPELSVEEVDVSLLDGIGLLHVDGSASRAQSKLMRAARERDITTVLDAEEITSEISELVALADYLVCSERFASQFTGEGSLEAMCLALIDRGPLAVVVTLGDEGSVAMRRETRSLIRVPAHDVEVLDTTGAGDVFHGAFIYGVMQAWPLERTVAFANVAGAIACTGLGGRSKIAGLGELEELGAGLA